MSEKAIKDGISGVFALFGCIFLLTALADVQDISKLQMSSAHPVRWLFLIVGMVLCLLGIAAFLINHFSDKFPSIWPINRAVRKTKDKNGFEVELSGARISVHHGKLEEFQISNENSAVVLPGNEFFDDECIRDQRSALGAYMGKRFPMKIAEMHSLILEQAAIFPCKAVEKENGVIANSFGVGKCIFIDRPLNSPHRLILTSVTTKRARVGLKSEVSFIFAAISELQCLVADKRISGLILPVMGAGHGGLKSELALFSMVLAFSEVLGRDPCKHLKSIDIIVFKPDGAEPQISSSKIKAILGAASAMFA